MVVSSLQWRYYSDNHQPHDRLLNRSFKRNPKKTPKIRVTGLCWGIHRSPVNSPHKSPVTREMFPFDDVIMCYMLIRLWILIELNWSYSNPSTFIHWHLGIFRMSCWQGGSPEFRQKMEYITWILNLFPNLQYSYVPLHLQNSLYTTKICALFHWIHTIKYILFMYHDTGEI